MSAWVWVLLASASIWASLLTFSAAVLKPHGDHGWDDALAQTLCMGALYWPLSWLFREDPWLLLTAGPLLIAAAHAVSIKIIYQTTAARAAMLALFHGALSGLVLGGLAVLVAGITAYVWYGRIISDPMILVRVLLRLIGIEPPF